MTSLLQTPKRLAKLLASINVRHSQRPLTPTEVAEEIKSMLLELDGDKAELANRLPLSMDMIEAFLRLLKLPSEIHDIITWGSPNQNTGQISFSVAQHLGRLANPKDILKLVNASHAASKPITKDEVREMISFKRSNSAMPIEKCIAEITNVTRPLVIEHHIFISAMGESTIRLLEESSELNLDEHAMLVLSKTFPSGSVTGIKISKKHARVTLSQEGSKFIQSYADKNNLSKKDVIEHILKSG